MRHRGGVRWRVRILLLAGAVVAATWLQVTSAQSTIDPRYEMVLVEMLGSPEGRALIEAFRSIRRDYLGEAEAARLLQGALRGMILELDDRYVTYLDADEVAADRREARDPDVVEAGLIGDFAYLRLPSFDSERAGERFATELERLLERGVAGVIVDLRGNPGGLVLGGLQVLDLFLSEVVLGYRTTRFGQVPMGFANPRAVELPLAVLIDRDTASTAEIVAGALQTRGRARLYGEVSAGKGVGQSTVPLSDGGELRLVTFIWVLPDGRSVDGWGLTPDVPVRWQTAIVDLTELAQVVERPDLDPVLAAAVRDLVRLDSAGTPLVP